MTTEPATTPTYEDVTGKRIVAALIDILIIFVFAVIMAVLFGDTESGDGGASFELSGLPAIITFIAVFAYYFVMEATSGQTVGKKVMGIKVISLDGQLSYGKVAIRTILRILDGLPVFYLVGIIAIAVSKQKQRIGDLAAGTLVVKA
jgi:uncharacterized RDD family membrane protein YckC